MKRMMVVRSTSLQRFLTSHREVLVVGLVALAIGIWAHEASLDFTGGDAKGSLLTAQALVEHGSPCLDPYPHTEHWGYRVEEIAGRRYYRFPLGTSLLTVPVVAVAALFGDHPADDGYDRRLQRDLAALTVAAVFVLGFLILRLQASFGFSLAFMAAFVLGSSLVSTMAIALWSFNFSVVLTLGALLHLARCERDGGVPNGPLLATLMFWAYLCRPTAAVPVILVGLLLLWRQRSVAFAYAKAVGLWALLFCLFSCREFGTFLPPYYSPGRINTEGFIPAALYGNLLSPARGLFVYTPLIVVVLAAAATCARRVWRSPLFLFGLAWLVIHWLSISRFGHWWGGWSYGPRLFTDALPAVVIMTAGTVEACRRTVSPRVRRVLLGVGAAAALFGVWTNAWQGLHNPYVITWNRYPNVDYLPAAVNDWRYPQFLACYEHQVARGKDYVRKPLPILALDETYFADSNRIVGIDWNDVERDNAGHAYRWSNGPRPLLLVRLPVTAADEAPTFRLELMIGAKGRHEATVLWNGQVAGSFSHEGFAPARQLFTLPAAWLRRDDGADLHDIELRITDGRWDRRDLRRIAFALHSLHIAPGSGDPLDGQESAEPADK